MHEQHREVADARDGRASPVLITAGFGQEHAHHAVFSDGDEEDGVRVDELLVDTSDASWRWRAASGDVGRVPDVRCGADVGVRGQPDRPPTTTALRRDPVVQVVGRLQELETVPEAVPGVEAAEPREVVIEPDLVARLVETRSHVIQSVRQDPRVWAATLFDAGGVGFGVAGWAGGGDVGW